MNECEYENERNAARQRLKPVWESARGGKTVLPDGQNAIRDLQYNDRHIGCDIYQIVYFII